MLNQKEKIQFPGVSKFNILAPVATGPLGHPDRKSPGHPKAAGLKANPRKTGLFLNVLIEIFVTVNNQGNELRFLLAEGSLEAKPIAVTKICFVGNLNHPGIPSRFGQATNRLQIVFKSTSKVAKFSPGHRLSNGDHPGIRRWIGYRRGRAFNVDEQQDIGSASP